MKVGERIDNKILKISKIKRSNFFSLENFLFIITFHFYFKCVECNSGNKFSSLI